MSNLFHTSPGSHEGHGGGTTPSVIFHRPGATHKPSGSNIHSDSHPSPTSNTPSPVKPSTKSFPTGSTSISSNSNTAGQHGPMSTGPVLQRPSKSNSHLSKGSTGLATGEVAGIAIACAVIGAVIAGFIVFFVMRKSNRRNRPVPLADQRAGSDTGQSRSWSEQEKKPAALAAPIKNSQSMPDLDHILPQPADTKYLNNELSTLRSLIHNHLNNFFSTKSIDQQLLASSIEPSALAEISADTPFGTNEWIALLASTKTRTNALRFIFAWVIFRRLEPECEPSKTLLPPGITACYRHMTDHRHTTDFPEKKRVGGYLQSRWRVITGCLLREQYVTRAFGDTDDRATNLRDTVRMLDAVVRPLGVEELDTARKDNMNEVLKRAAAIGFILASQPSSWIFDWEPPNQGQRATPLVVFPSLIQSTNDQGQSTTGSLEIGEKELGNSILISE